jgi:hypothetical protein
MKTDWEVIERADGTFMLTRWRTPLWIWVLDRWLRIPDFIFDRIEWWFPRTTRITRIPCILYSRWTPERIIRQEWTAFDVQPQPDKDEDVARTSA